MLTLQELEDRRERKGWLIANGKSQIRKVNGTCYEVRSQSGDGSYLVSLTESGWVCECPDSRFRWLRCKHAYAVEYSIALRNAVGATRIEPIPDQMVCRVCASKNIVKDGERHNLSGDLQVYECRTCGCHSTMNFGFEKMQSTPQVVTSALQLYFSGASLRAIERFLKLKGVSVSHVAVYKWIRKYVGLMGKYLDRITPDVSDTWRADELYVKIRGDMKYLFALMDDETRFWIAQEVSGSKARYDARGLFRAGKHATGKKPKTLISDGLPAYRLAYLKEFWTQKKATRTQHIRHIKIRGDMNNNKMERFNGEVRDREKVMRGLKKEDTPILRGYQLFHNFVRPHEGLDGRTPAEACGIEIVGEDKWMTLIQNASYPPSIAKTKIKSS